MATFENDIQVVDRNTWKYNASNPNESFTLTHSTAPCGDTWTYKPVEENPMIATGRAGIVAIDEIVSKLPRLTLWEAESDYPKVPALNLQKNPCYDTSPVSKRPIWILGGVAFFRRYNDDWNATVMCTNKYGWAISISTSQLIKIRDLVFAKDPLLITNEEIIVLIK